MLTINGFWFKQRNNSTAPKVFVGELNAKELLQYSEVDVVRRGSDGIQRILVPSRVKKVKKYFDDTNNENNIIPTSITISIEKDFDTEQSNDSKLVFDVENNNKFIKIIDGQHRLEGLAKSVEDLKIVVIAFIKPSEIEKAFQFVVINNKSHKVPVVHVKSLIANYETIEEDLGLRLNRVGISFSHVKDVDMVDKESDSPLQGLIEWTNNPEGTIKINAIEQTFEYIIDRISEAEDDESLKRDILYQIWGALKYLYPTIWNIPKQEINHLFEKSVFYVLSVLLIDNIFSYVDNKSEFTGEDCTVLDENIFYESTVSYMKGFPLDFWTVEWTKKGLDTTAGRILIKKSIEKIRDNIRKKDENIFSDVVLLKD